MWISALKTLFPESVLIYTSWWIPRLLAKGIQKQQSCKLLQEPNTNTNTNTEAQIQIQRTNTNEKNNILQDVSSTVGLL